MQEAGKGAQAKKEKKGIVPFKKAAPQAPHPSKGKAFFLRLVGPVDLAPRSPRPAPRPSTGSEAVGARGARGKRRAIGASGGPRVAALSDHVLRQFCTQNGRFPGRVAALSDDVLRPFCTQNGRFPGRAAALSDHVLTPFCTQNGRFPGHVAAL